MAHQCSTVATGRKVKLIQTHKEARVIGPNNQSSELLFSISFICQINKIPAKPEPLCIFQGFFSSGKDIVLLYLSLEQPLVDSYPPISIPCLYLVAEYSVLESLHSCLLLVLFSALTIEKFLRKTGMMQRIATVEKSFHYACS